MIKADEARNPNSCFNKAGSNEPIFVLRANDETAPRIVRAWAGSYRENKMGWKHMTERQRAKYDEALALADQMEKWQEEHGH